MSHQLSTARIARMIKIYGLCKHCTKKSANAARGLCAGCYSRPAIRAAYPRLKNTVAAKPVPNFGGAAKEPETITNAEPGSVEKLEVLCARAERGQELFASGDGWHDLR